MNDVNKQNFKLFSPSYFHVWTENTGSRLRNLGGNTIFLDPGPKNRGSRFYIRLYLENFIVTNPDTRIRIIFRYPDPDPNFLLQIQTCIPTWLGGLKIKE